MTSLFAAAILSAPQALDAPLLILLQKDGWVIKQGAKKELIPQKSRPEPKPPTHWMWHKGKCYLVWDERGLTVRQGKWVYSTHLKEIALSPKVHSHESLVLTKARIERGLRSPNVNALLGSAEVQGKVYLHFRWAEKAFGNWLEALVRVDPTELNPKPELLGKLDGRSLADSPLGDGLFALPEGVGSLQVSGKAWGVGWFGIKDQAFAFDPVGESLVGIRRLSGKSVLYQEKTAWGSRLWGSFDLTNGKRTELFEARNATIDWLKPGKVGVIKERGKLRLRDFDSGAERTLVKGATVRLTTFGALVWWPADKPTDAILFGYRRWNGLAAWSPPSVMPPEKKVAPKPRSHNRPKPLAKPGSRRKRLLEVQSRPSPLE